MSYAPVDKAGDSKKVEQPQKTDASASLISDNRLSAVSQLRMQQVMAKSPQVSQLQAKQALMGSSSMAAGLSSGADVVQRVISVDGITYGGDDTQAFEDRYNEAHRTAMLRALTNGVPNSPASLADALSAERRFLLTLEANDSDAEEQNEDPQIFYYAKASAVITNQEGGRIREAGYVPELITKHASNFEKLKVSGLVTCVGIFIEARGDDGVVAATASHFVTPDCMDGEALNEDGVGLVQAQYDLIAGRGALKAILRYSGEADGKTQDALNEIEYFLGVLGVGTVERAQGAGEVIYCLNANGTSAIT